MKTGRNILRELSLLFNVDEKDLPKTLQRFKDEVEEMENKIRKIKSH